MSWLKTLRRELHVSVAGIREGLISIAERVDARAERVRLGLAASETDRRLQEELLGLGRCVYERRHLRRSDLESDKAVESILFEIDALQKKRSMLDDLARDSVLFEINAAFVELQQALHASGKTLQVWKVEGGSPFSGREVREFQLTERSFLLALIRRGKIVSPGERVHFAQGDRLLVAGPVLELEALKERFAG
jgi:uncharacterized protein with PhoU and TrkA domain